VFVARTTYETERSDAVYVFNSVDITGGSFRLSASVPFIRQRVRPAGSLVDRAVASTPVTNTGFGDPLIRLDVWLVDDWSRRLQVGVSGSVKPAVIDAADGLGTGAADYGVGVSVFNAVGPTAMLADVSFWKYGDPEGIDFENALSYSFGIGRTLGTGRWSTLVSLAGFSPTGDASPPLLLTLGIMALTGRSQSLSITAGFGLTDSASDYSIGASWRIQN
jgi:hypothetical protein